MPYKTARGKYVYDLADKILDRFGTQALGYNPREDAQALAQYAMSVPGTRALEIAWPTWFDLRDTRFLVSTLTIKIERKQKEIRIKHNLQP